MEIGTWNNVRANSVDLSTEGRKRSECTIASQEYPTLFVEQEHNLTLHPLHRDASIIVYAREMEKQQRTGVLRGVGNGDSLWDFVVACMLYANGSP